MPSAARRLVPLAAVAWLCAVGCKRDEAIRSYDVARETPPTRANPHADMSPPPMRGGMPAAAGGPQRLLVAWVPSGPGYNLFVKLSAPVDAVAPHPDAFKALVASLRYTGDDRNPAAFAAPAGWQLDPKPRQFRAATLTPAGGPAEKPVEITISTPIGGSVLDNVNRWRGQIGLPPADEAGLAKDIAALPAAGGEAKFLDLSGPGAPAGPPPVRGPFQK